MAIQFASGDVLEHPQLNNMVRALNGDGVLSDPGSTSLEVIARSPAIMGVRASIGKCKIDTTIETEAGTNDLTIEASHATLERKDLITYDASANTPAVVKGTNRAGTDADPTYPPDIPAGDILLAIVKVDAAATTIPSGDITDCRIMVDPGYKYSGSSAYSGNAPITWTDLDMSSVVGSVRALVLFKLTNNSTTSTRTYSFRPNGDTDEYYNVTYPTPTNFKLFEEMSTLVTIQTDASGVIEWKASGANDTDIVVLSFKRLLV